MYNQQFYTIPKVYSTPTGLEINSYVTTGVTLTQGAKLLGIICENTLANPAYCQLFDTTTLPPSGTVPAVSWKIGATTQLTLSFGDVNCHPVTNGIWLGLSQTGTNYLPSTGAAMQVVAYWLNPATPT